MPIPEQFKKKEYNPLKDARVFIMSHSDIEKTGMRQCRDHTWRKLNHTEIACTRCPTVHIVDNADNYGV